MREELDIAYYLELQKRFKEITLYIACHDDNFRTYSVKIENLFVDICAFFDSLCQTFIREKTASSFSNAASVCCLSDKITGTKYFNIIDYKTLLENAFNLSSKEIILNLHEDYFYGNPAKLWGQMQGYKIKPFDKWSGEYNLEWWQAFTKLKHNRLDNMKEATLKQVIYSLGATYIILSLKNEKKFKDGAITLELYEVFFPQYWKEHGRISSGTVLWM